MKKLTAWRLLLDGCMGGLFLVGALHAAPADWVISTPEAAQTFTDAAPFVFSGQALVVDTGFSTDRSIVLERFAPIMVGTGAHFELNGGITSQAPPMSAPLEKRGLGTLALTAQNRYTSNTVLREGTLHLEGASAMGNPIYNLEQSTGTVLSLGADARVLNHIRLTRQRAGDESLQGVEDEVQWRVASGTATLLHSVNALAPIRKTGAGALRITDIVQGRPVFRVEAGSLIVDGMVTGPVDIAGGARLEGSGSLADIHARSGAMVAPGGREAVAVLRASGDVRFDPGSVFHVNAQADGKADLLDVRGEAKLDGRVWAETAAGLWEPEQRYRILSAEGGVGDTAFARVDTSLAFLDPELDYDANTVYLTLRRNDLNVGDVGDTPDDQEVGDAIDPPRPRQPRPRRPARPVAPPDLPPLAEDPPAVVETPDPISPPAVLVQAPAPEPEAPAAPVSLTPLQQAMLSMSPEQARSALRQLSGSWHASARSFLMEDSRYVREAVLASAPPADVNGLAGAQGLRTWGHGYAAMGSRQWVAGVPGDHHDSRGMILGLDTDVARHWRVGGVFAGTQARLKRDGGQASATMDSVHAGLSAHGRIKGVRLTVGLLRGWHRIKSQRRVMAGPLWDILGATYTGRSWQAVVEFAPSLRKVGPYLRHEWMRLQIPAYQERGGVAAHGVRASSMGRHATTLGWRWRHELEQDERPIRLEASLGWRHAWGSADVAAIQRFEVDTVSGAPSPWFSSQGQPLARNALMLGAGVFAAPSRNLQISARYSGRYGRAHRDHAAWAEARWWF